MRYYDITITDADSGTTVRKYSSLTNGKSNPAALNVELDVPVAAYATPLGGAFVRIWGIPLSDIGSAADLNFKNVTVLAGMQKGLPLANPQQSGLIVFGIIQQAFGNWQGVNMTLDLLVTTGQLVADAPANLAYMWTKGTKLSDVIETTLATAFPKFKRQIAISDSLVLAYDAPGFYGSIVQFAQFIRQLSIAVIGGKYQGVDIVIKNDTFMVYDGTTQTAPKTIAFIDLVGQPTWVDAGRIQLTCVMRADLTVGDYVKLPESSVLTTAASYSQYRQKSVFQGVYQIDMLRHVGNFRSPDGTAWVTTIDCHPAAAT